MEEKGGKNGEQWNKNLSATVTLLPHLEPVLGTNSNICFP